MTERFQDLVRPAVIALCGMAVSVAACCMVWGAEERNAARRLDYASLETFDDIVGVLEGDVEATQAVGEHLDVTGPVTRAEFHALAVPALRRHPTLLHINWAPRVAARDRAALEAAARHDGIADFRIGERTPQGTLVAAAARAEYFPLLAIESLQDTTGILGFDLTSEPVRRAALVVAAATGDTVATPRLLLAGDHANQAAALSVTPVYRKGSAPATDEQRNEALVGYVIGAYRIGDVVNRVMAAPGRARLDIHLFDMSADGRQLYPDSGNERLSDLRDRPHVERPFRVGGRSWLLVSTPASDFEVRRWRTSWLLLAAGLGLTALAAAFAHASASRKRVRVSAERLVRRERDFTRSVIDSLPGVFYVIGADGRFELWNRRAEVISGFDADEIANMAPTEFFRSEDAALIGGKIAEVFDRGWSEVEVPLVTKAGERIPFHFSSQRMDSDGDPKLIGVGIDISARKRAEEELRSSEEKLRALFELSPLGLALNAMDGRFLAGNQAFLRIVGYTADQLGHLTYWDITPPSFAEDEARQLDALRTAGRYGPYEKDYLHSSGRRVPVCLNGVLVTGGDGQHYIWSIVEDVTGRRAAERAMREKTEELAHSNAELEQFAYVASHDLREPLRMVSAYVSLLDRRYGQAFDAEGREFIAYAKEGAERMDRLILDLLEYSRIGRKARPADTVVLGDALREAVRVLGPQIAEAAARVEVAGEMPTVVGDYGDLVRLFQNLMGNALKYREPDRVPEVTVTAARAEGEWIVSVADNGIGIAPEYFDRIFLIFQRLHTRDRYEGTGIGLAICRRIVEHHGGRIWVESVPGRGTTFHVALPAVA
jgi:PAS domain S-box-containing protein